VVGVPAEFWTVWQAERARADEATIISRRMSGKLLT